MWWLVAFLACVFSANYLAQWTIPVGIGLVAPAGVLTIGLGFGFRDMVHQRYGAWAALVVVWVAGVLSWLVVGATLQQIALASVVAYTLSETLDTFVYAPLRRRGFVRAVLASNAVGLVADSVIFLQLAFGSLDYLWGQIWAKSVMTLIFVGAVYTAAWITHATGSTPQRGILYD